MDPTWTSATALAQALKLRRIGAVELLEHQRRRVEARNAGINAVVVTDWERARARAERADVAFAQGDAWGPLHGVSMTVKESFDVEGLPTTSGSAGLKDNVATRHSDAAQRLVDAGAIVYGKTNVPLFTGDLQTYNEVYGTTNNPWDLSRGPGGSSGGAAAALAAGLTPLELGSDIGGSIRNPAHFCGVYGHKPSYGLISLRGHVPGAPGSWVQPDIGVAGPMARHAEDLDLGLSVMAGPNEWDAVGWKVDLPPPRGEGLKDYRIAVCPDHAFCRVDSEIADLVVAAADALARAGAQVGAATPKLEFGDSFRRFYGMLSATLASDYPDKLMERLAGRAATAVDPASLDTVFARGATQSHAAYLRAESGRQNDRAVWASFFRDWDVFLCPVIMTPAFPHDQQANQMARRLVVNGELRPYMDAVGWAGLIGNVRLPSTAVPIGRTKAGLPVGMQIVGPYLEDRTCIDVAKHLAGLIGGFVAPPGYA